jgi:hypothetical protein
MPIFSIIKRDNRVLFYQKLWPGLGRGLNMGYLFLYSKRIHYEGDVAHQKLSDLESQRFD